MSYVVEVKVGVAETALRLRQSWTPNLNWAANMTSFGMDWSLETQSFS